MSGIPYASASITVPSGSATPLCIQFPYVAKFVTIANVGSSVPFRVGFSAKGVSGSASNYFVVSSGSSYTGDWRIEDLYLISDTSAQSSASIIAGLTPIPRGVPPLGSATGNNWSGSSGVG